MMIQRYTQAKSTHKPGYCYRLCKKCGLDWNVSGKYKTIRQYICPICEYKERKKNGFIQMRTPKNRMELRADFNNYDDLIRAVKAIKEEARIMYREKYREEDFR